MGTLSWVLREALGCRYVCGTHDPLLLKVWVIIQGLKTIAP